MCVYIHIHIYMYYCCSVTKSCLTVYNPMDCSMPDFPVLHCLLEFAQIHVHWIVDAIQPLYPLWPPSPLCVYSVASVVSDSVTLWTVARQAPLSTGFSRHEYWSGLPCPAPGDHPDSAIKPASPTLQANSLPNEPPGKPFPPLCVCLIAQLCPAHCDPMDCQAPLSMKFSRKEYWSGLPFPAPGNLSNPGIELVSLVSPTLAGRFFTTVLPGKSPLPLYTHTHTHTYNSINHELILILTISI